jgi:hypothetical protein
MLSDDFPLEQFYRDARIHTIYEGSTGIQGLDLLGCKVTIKNVKAAVLFIQKIAKAIASASISVQFFDHTAHNYIHAICNDLRMHYVDGYSAEWKPLWPTTSSRRR